MKKLLIALFVISSTFIQAQIKKPYFNTLDVKSGLPEAYVYSSLEDNNGYLWMGTQNGLVRYDGYRFKPYPILNSKGNIIAPVSIRNLLQDRNGKIWAYTRENGINYYDAQADKFIQVPFDQKTIDEIVGQVFSSRVEDVTNNVQWLLLINPVTQKRTVYKFNTNNNTLQEYDATSSGKKHLPVKIPARIIKDAKDKVWLAGDSLLSFFDVKNQQFTPYFTLPSSLKGNRIVQLTPDPTDIDILWINTYQGADLIKIQPALHGKNVVRFNIKTKSYQLFSVDNKNATSIPANCNNILTDSLKRIWLATEKGISLYNVAQNNFTNYTINFNQENITVNAICADVVGNVWVGGTFNNLYFLNTKTGLNQKIETNTYEGSLLPFGRGINKIFYDRSGTLWVSMPWTGIAYFDKQKTLFASSQLSSNNLLAADKIKGNPLRIKGILGDSICYVADTANLFAWHSRNNQFKKIDLKNKAAYKNIAAVVADKESSMWVATYGVGLFNYNSTTKTVKKWEHIEKDSLSLTSNNINKLAIDKEGTIWIGTADKGLCSYSPASNHFTNYPFIQNNNKTIPLNALDDSRVNGLLVDSEGIIWIGTNSGALNSYNPKTKFFKSYLNREQGFFCVPGIFEDSKKRIWAGTYLSGLFLINKQSGIVKKYTEADGLLHNCILSLTEDADGNIWCITLRGYSRLNPASNKIVSFPIAAIGSINSLDYLYKDAFGTIYQSYNEGMVSFNPADIQPNTIIPKVVIEAIQYKAAKTDKDTILFTTANQNITLSYNENKIEFQFVALHFADAAKNKYAFQLTGYDKDWAQAGTSRTATYTNLSPGTYTFAVKAANSDGVWNEKGTSITIKILPPWWQTWWAYIIYAFGFLSALRAFSLYREKRLRFEKEQLEEKVTERTTELKQSLESLKATQSQLVQSEKMASLGELTAGIAHEIQNPLNFVNNFSEVSTELIDEMNEEIVKGNYEDVKEIANDVKQNLDKINHHGKRAADIVKGMLQHSRSSSGVKEPTDINALCDEYLRLSYHGLRAKDKSFNATMKTDFDETIVSINILPQDIGRVVLNLINNAFYVVNEKTQQNIEGYEPTVSISTKKLDGKILITVSDNGNGIPTKVLDKIFQPFFTTKPTGQGTGLGLSLSYDIVKAHGGELKAVTKEGEGSEFIITIPI